MKKVLLLMMALLTLSLCAQVRIMKPAEGIEGFSYDSLTNTLNEKNLWAYVGQDVQVLPYKSFIAEGDFYVDKSMLFKRSNRANLKDITGRVFTITDAFSYSSHPDMKPSSFLELTDKETKNKFYFLFSQVSDRELLLLGYKEKFEQTHKGEQFVWRMGGMHNKDFKTGDDFLLKSGEVITLDEMIYNTHEEGLGYLFYDAHGHSLFLNDIEMKTYLTEKATVDKYKSLYGEAQVELALAHDVRIGMPRDLLILSEGRPDEINRTSYNEQYVYKMRSGRIKCYYLENGEVTGWN